MKIIFKNGFTIIEVLIVMSILVLILTVFLKPTLEFSRDYSSIKNDTLKIKSVIETAKNKSFIQEYDSNWGVYFVNSSSAYYLFSGDSFASSNNFSQYFLDDNNMFTDPSTNTTKEVIFQKGTGYTSSTKISISSINSKIKADILINNLGNVDIIIKKE